jgi:2,3-bisphosphoglycerate-independent phosphoglycerate mutase
MIVTADHGNADEMIELNKSGEAKTDKSGNPQMKTSHTLNPVPCYIYDVSGKAGLKLAGTEGLGISSLAATSMVCLGYQPPADYDQSIVEVGS